MTIRLFIDFDGTITENDVGYELFKKFTRGATEQIVTTYRNGLISSLECLSGECGIWNDILPDSKEVFEFLDEQKLSRGFIEFINYVRKMKIEPVILSEGFDFYIDRILESNGLSDLTLISNRGEYLDSVIHPEFPYNGLGCGTCSNCKGYHIDRLSEPSDLVIYIGDGHSDRHGAEKADIVFAKSFLKEHMVASGRTFYEYADFEDISRLFTEIVDREREIIRSRESGGENL